MDSDAASDDARGEPRGPVFAALLAAMAIVVFMPPQFTPAKWVLLPLEAALAVAFAIMDPGRITDAIVSNHKSYGAIGTVMIMFSFLIGLGVVVHLGRGVGTDVQRARRGQGLEVIANSVAGEVTGGLATAAGDVWMVAVMPDA